MAEGSISSFGTLLRRYRRAQGITQQALAATAGYSEVYIGMLERGDRLPSGATAEALADALALGRHQRESLIAATHTAIRGMGRGMVRGIGALAPVSGLVGRVRELALLQQHLEGDGPALLALAGEPGIGKTRLLQEVVERAPADGWNVMVGGSHLQGGKEPFTPLLDALERYTQSEPAATLQHELEGCAWLTRLLPELTELGVAPPPGWQLPPEQERRLIFKAVRRFLANVAGPSGTLMVLDDIQWASVDALDLLAHLVRAPAEVPLRIVVAYRTTEVQPEEPWGVLLTDLIRAGQAAKIELAPLTLDEAKELLGSVLDESLREREREAERERAALVERVLHRAGGMPLFLVSYAQAMRSMTSGAGNEAGTIPRDVVEGMRQRVAALPKESQELLAVAGIVGRQAPRRLLQSVMARHGHAENEVLLAIEGACRARLLVEEGEDAYGFSHDVVHEAIVADMSAARRAVLHRQVAEALEQGLAPQPAEVLAYHFARGGAAERAVWYLERAGDHALALRAHGEAARVYGELAAQLDALERPMEAAAAREKLGAVQMTMAQYDAALDALNRAEETYRAASDMEGVVRVMARIGEVHVLRCSSEEGIARLEAVLSMVRTEEISTRSMAALMVTLAWLINTTSRYSEALRMAQRAAELADAAGDSALLLATNLRRGHLLLMLEQMDEGVRILEEAIPQVEAVGDLRGLRFALNMLGWINELRGNFEEDRRYTERAFRVAEQLADPTMLAYMRSNHGSPAFNLGDWRAARADFEAGIELMRPLGASWASAWPPLLLGQLCLAEGERAAGEAHLREAIGLAEWNNDLEALRWAHGTLAERDLLYGMPEQARARLQPLLDRSEERELDVCPLLPLLARALADLGQVDEAEVVTREALARATAAGLRPVVVSGLQARSEVARRRGEWEQAQADLEAALALSREIRQPYGEAKVLFALGTLLMQQQESDAGRRYLTEARDILTRLGERMYGERVEEALDRRPVQLRVTRTGKPRR